MSCLLYCVSVTWCNKKFHRKEKNNPKNTAEKHSWYLQYTKSVPSTEVLSCKHTHCDNTDSKNSLKSTKTPHPGVIWLVVLIDHHFCYSQHNLIHISVNPLHCFKVQRVFCWLSRGLGSVGAGPPVGYWGGVVDHRSGGVFPSCCGLVGPIPSMRRSDSRSGCALHLLISRCTI